jgi:arylsulfatase
MVNKEEFVRTKETHTKRKIKMRSSRILIVTLFLLFTVPSFAGDKRPNFLVILTDDLGFSDIGCYGSEIETPTLDKLAADGMRFTQFYNTAKCHSSRVSLLTGRWCRQAGSVNLNRGVTIAEVLGAGGYFTAMSGKWHLSKEPTDFGFQRYFGHLSGATNYYKGNNTFRLNGKPWAVPEKDFYTTVAKVDFALKFLDEARQSKKPWLLYVAFNAPHAPLQPLEDDYRRYEDKYEDGWDTFGAARAAKQAKLGLFGKDIEPAPRPDHIPAWKDLSPENRGRESRRMAAYAGLIDRIDQEIGRLVSNLESNGELDNTLILFFSDNGACSFGKISSELDLEPYERDTTWSDSTGWAWARNTPFRFYKQNQFEGGIATPAIVHWPAGLKTKPGSIDHTPAHLVDVLPTLAELAGVSLPDKWPKRDLTPIAGVSLAPVFAGGELKNRPPIHLLFSSDRGLRDGDWKLVSFRSQPWELYNIARDRTEQNNLVDQQPEIAERMITQWNDMTENVLMAPQKEYAPVAEVFTGYENTRWAFSPSPEDNKESKSKSTTSKQKSIRARKGTKLNIIDGQLMLQCEGSDPGLAFNTLPFMGDVGPYTLEFGVISHAAGGGEIYWTTDAKTVLPKGGHLEFDVKHNGQWQNISLNIPEKKRLYALRLDPCASAGEARIEGLKLMDSSGKIIKSWPE